MSDTPALPDPSAAPQWEQFCRRVRTIVPKDGRRKVVIDCDAGVDDIDAILMTLNAPDIDVVAVTCVNGNCPRDQVIRNVRRTLFLCGRSDIPVFAGAVGPLVEPPRDAGYFHGPDGIGGLDANERAAAAKRLNLTDPTDLAVTAAVEEGWPPLQEENAVNALLRLARRWVLPEEELLHPLRPEDTLQARAERLLALAAQQEAKATAAAAPDKREYEEAHTRHVDSLRLKQRARGMHTAASLCGGRPCAGVLEVLSLAPVTNLALAARMDNAFAGAIKNVTIMAGADKTRGNTPLMPAVEFNAHADPEALAALVSSFENAVLVPFDCCLKHEWTWEEVKAWHDMATTRSKFAACIGKHTGELLRSWGLQFSTADPLAAAILLQPERMVHHSKIKHRHVAVELNPGSPTHGQTVVDHMGYSCQEATTWVMASMRHEVLDRLMRIAYMDTADAHKAVAQLEKDIQVVQ